MHWLKQQKAGENPFFINVWFHESHSVVAAPDSLKQRHSKNKAYYGCIENMDIAVGRLRNYLKENQLDKNTLILFSSDNGSQMGSSNDPLRGEKCFQYEGGIRVPFIAHWTGKIKPGINTKTLGHFTDVLPTIAAFTGCKLSEAKPVDGEDLSQVFVGDDEDFEREKPLFFYRYFHDPICMLRKHDMVLLGYQNPPKERQTRYNVREEALFKPAEGEPSWAQWSFQESHMEALKLQEPKYFELYNIKNDIGEYSDLAEQLPEVLEDMKKSMLKTRKEMLAEGGDWYQYANN